LAETLSSHNKAATLREAGAAGKKHGIERAYQADYSISEVLVEYWILRDVVFHSIEEKDQVPISARSLVLAAVDEGIRKAVEEFAAAKSRILEQSNRDLEHFATVAAHDLKSPLATITGYLELISDGAENKLDEPHISYIKTVRRSAAQMSVMIDRLLDYSSVGREHAPFKTLDLNEIVERTQANIMNLIEKTKASIHVGELPTVSGEATLLSMVMQNLLSNAIKFKSADPPVISIQAQEDSGYWIISIADNGIGFDPRHGENIFSLFKQIHHTRKSQGLGVGLAITKKIIELHGGRIWAKSAPGEGSTFYFSLPQ
jgi:light-regulated signal transduction histidine kinase (bacteriophytochrome)